MSGPSIFDQVAFTVWLATLYAVVLVPAWAVGQYLRRKG